VDLFESRKGRRVDGLSLAKIDVLVKQAKFEAVHLDDLAFVGAFLTDDEAKNGRLARAVAANEADLFGEIDLERDAL
jgi:hypothetical protein